MTHPEQPATTPDRCMLWIESVPTAPGSHRPSACLITWNDQKWYAPVDDVRTTATDLVSAAAYADVMMQLISMGLPAAEIAAFMADVMKRQKRHRFGCPSTLLMRPAGSTRQGTAVVLLRHSAQREAVDSDTARSLAQQWFEVAEATEQDRLLFAALTGTGSQPEHIGLLFAELRRLRDVTD